MEKNTIPTYIKLEKGGLVTDIITYLVKIKPFLYVKYYRKLTRLRLGQIWESRDDNKANIEMPMY